MSVIVKGVSVPKNCYTCAKYRWSPLCPCRRGDANTSYYRTSRHPDCPLVEVKVPHGRLGDLDKLKYDIVVGNEKYLGLNEPCLEDVTPIENVDDCIDAIAFAPTIIDAEWREK